MFHCTKRNDIKKKLWWKRIMLTVFIFRSSMCLLALQETMSLGKFFRGGVNVHSRLFLIEKWNWRWGTLGSFIFQFSLPMEEKIVSTPRGFFFKKLRYKKRCFIIVDEIQWSTAWSRVKFPLTFEWKLSISRFQNRFVSNYLFLFTLLRESNSKVIS